MAKAYYEAGLLQGVVLLFSFELKKELSKRMFLRGENEAKMLKLFEKLFNRHASAFASFNIHIAEL